MDANGRKLGRDAVLSVLFIVFRSVLFSLRDHPARLLYARLAGSLALQKRACSPLGPWGHGPSREGKMAPPALAVIPACQRIDEDM